MEHPQGSSDKTREHLRSVAAAQVQTDAADRLHHSSFIHRYRLDLFAALWVPYALLVVRFWYVTDDAFITFRYARNFALGHGLRYNLGDHTPVEGYSNFLWVLICSIFEFFRMEITVWPLLLSAACGTLLLWLVFDLLRRRLELNLVVVCLATLSLGCFPPLAVWSTSGLATIPFALLVFVTFERLVLRRGGAAGISGGVAGLLLALIRIEGIGWALVILILALVSRRIAGQRSLRPFVWFVLIVGVGYGLYFAGRYAYYQMPLPNTVYVKGELDGARLVRGVNYVVSHVLTFVTPILIVPGSVVALRRKRVALGLPVAALAWAFPVYSVVVTGDFMAMGRFLVPALAFNAVLFAWILQDLWGGGAVRRAVTVAIAVVAIAIGFLPGTEYWNGHLAPRSLLERFRFRFNTEPMETEYEQWRNQRDNVVTWAARGRALRSYLTQRSLADPHPSYVAGAIGAVGYYSDLYMYDKHGLVTPEVARRVVGAEEALRSPGHDKQVPREYFLKDNPTILLAVVVQHEDPRAIANECSRQAGLLRRCPPELRLARRYAPDFARVPGPDSGGEPRYVVTWTCVGEGVRARDAWNAFEQRLSVLGRGEHFALPP